ncbi:MAG: gamma-glutamylcyclotransferase [Candidatus Latescibacteria bacterium]|jgi:gamma-glutamylcyclotransferase (GGCT)/AIG2-like uncharacterized protein YtfP|nr:gamma-glutamylcyclotransferase [Candidatus Latescibacterota bacterium]MBT5832116.1 gamma-glutamylcyclotransferase [Candidatus Latescibacterota bacterium]
MFNVFVYGVARPAYNLGKLEYLNHCPAILNGYEMCIFGAYPTIVPGRGKVIGDLVGVDIKGFEFISEMEGWIGEKEDVMVLVEGGETCSALTFVSPVLKVGAAHRLLSGDWLDSW